MHVTLIWGVVSSNSSYFSCLFFFIFFMSFIPGFVFALLEGDFTSHSNSKVQILIFSNVKSQNLHYCSVLFFPSPILIVSFCFLKITFYLFAFCCVSVFFCLFSVILTFPPTRLQIVLPWGVISYFLTDGLATDTQIWSNCVNIYQLGIIGEGIWHYSILLTC